MEIKLCADENGFFGKYGGAFVPSELKKELKIIAEKYAVLKTDENFLRELAEIRRDYQGRPTPLYFCKKLTEITGGADIFLKREDLNHTGAHKINHCMGEGLLAKYLGKTKMIAETGAGQHGLAIATACAYFGMDCDIYMGSADVRKQFANVQKMKLLGANVIEVSEGQGTLKEAVDAAFAAYARDCANSIYCIGSVVGPFPFPEMIADFQSVVGGETKDQYLARSGRLPDGIVACIGGGSNAMGIFRPFINTDVPLYGVEPLGKGTALGEHAASIACGKEGILHGFNSLVLTDDEGNVAPAYSVASGLDYPSVGPQHAFLNSIGRVNYVGVTDSEAVSAFYLLTRTEGIIPALESAHAVAYGLKLAKELGKGKGIVINLSGRGDKDADYVLQHFGNV